MRRPFLAGRPSPPAPPHRAGRRGRKGPPGGRPRAPQRQGVHRPPRPALGRGGGDPRRAPGGGGRRRAGARPGGAGHRLGRPRRPGGGAGLQQLARPPRRRLPAPDPAADQHPGPGRAWRRRSPRWPRRSPGRRPASATFLAFVGKALILDPAATRLALDPVSPADPVLLVTWTSHSALIDPAAMALAGLAEDEPDPFGGSYDRFPGTDTLNGVVNEYGLFQMVRALRDAVPDAVLRARLRGPDRPARPGGQRPPRPRSPIGLTRERSDRVLAGADLKARLRTICVPMAVDEPCRPTRSTPAAASPRPA